MRKLSLFIFFILIISTLGQAHEDHFDEGEIYWSWDTAVKNGDLYTWELKVHDSSNQVNGLIDIEVVDQVSDINIRQEIENNPSYLGMTPSLVMTSGSEITSYTIVYAPIHFILPVFFNYGNGTSGNYFDLQIYKNETIPLIYFSLGFSREYDDIKYEVNSDIATITGTFSSLVSNTTGEFEVVYRKSGILQYFEWNDSEGNGHIIELQEGILKQLSIPTIPVLLAILLLPIFTHYLVKLKDE